MQIHLLVLYLYLEENGNVYFKMMEIREQRKTAATDGFSHNGYNDNIFNHNKQGTKLC